MGKFKVGDLVEHKSENYRGVVTDLSSHDGNKSRGFIRIKRDDGVAAEIDPRTSKYAVKPEYLKLIRKGVGDSSGRPITSKSLRLY